MKKLSWLKPLVFVLCLVPLAVLIARGVIDDLGANPIEEITHETGQWTLRFLLITLALTPMKLLFSWGAPIKFRRMLGLFTFFYAMLHFSTWLVLDWFFDLEEIIKDIIKRPYITVGFTALVLMTPLAITSTDKMLKRLGRNWKKLHRLVYVVAALGVVHFLWLVKADILEPSIYGAILALLLAARLPQLQKTKKRVPGDA